MAVHYGDFHAEIEGTLDVYPISYTGSGLFNLTPLAEEMLLLLPSYYCLGNNVRRIMELVAAVLADYQGRIDDVRDQFFVCTATWGLKFWEELVGLPISENLTDDERRELIKNRLRNCSSEKCFVEGLEAIVNGAVIVTLLNPATNPYQIDIELRSSEVVYPGPRTAPTPSLYGSGVLNGDYTYKVTYGFPEVFIPDYIVTNPWADGLGETNSGVSAIKTNEKQAIYGAGTNEEQTLTITGSGNYQITFDGVEEVTVLDETATGNDIVNSINALSPSLTYGNFSVSTSTPAALVTAGVTIIFDGLGVEYKNVPSLEITSRTGTIDVVGTNERQTVSTIGTGTFELTFDGVTTSSAFTEASTAGAIVAAINGLAPTTSYPAFTVSTPNAADIVGATGGVRIDFDGGDVQYENVPPLLITTPVGLTGTVEETVIGGHVVENIAGGNVNGGTFTITYDNKWDSTVLVDEEQSLEITGTGQFVITFEEFPDQFGGSEIQTIVTTGTPIVDGDYTLTVDDGAGGTVVTGDIAFNADAPTIQAAINAATPATANVVVTETETAGPDFGLGATNNTITITYTGGDFAFDAVVPVTIAVGTTPPTVPALGSEVVATLFQPIVLTDLSTGADVAAAVNNLSPTTANTFGNFSVTTTTPAALVTDPGGIIIKFDGDGVAHQDVPLLEIPYSNGTIAGTILEQEKGREQLSQLPNPYTTEALPWNATRLEIYDALTALPTIAPSTLLVTGGPLPQYPVFIEFVGYESGFPQSMLGVDGLLLSGPGQYYENRLQTGGSTYGDSESITITATNERILLSNVPISPEGASIRNIYRKRVDLTPPPFNTVNVGSPYNEYRYVGSIDDNVITVFVDNVPDGDLSEVQKITFEQTDPAPSPGAQYRIRFDSMDTVTLTAASDKVAVKAALDGLTASLGYNLAVTVTGSFENGFTVYFNGGDVIGTDVPQMEIIPLIGSTLEWEVETLGPRVLTEKNSAFTFTFQRALDYVHNTKPAHIHVRQLRSAAFRASISRAGEPV